MLQVGGDTSIVVTTDGNAIVSYYRITNGDLGLAVCHDPTCATFTLRTLDSAGLTGQYTSLALTNNGNPVVSYYEQNNGDLKLAVCGDPTCSTAPTLRTLDSVGDVGRHSSLALTSNDNPVVAYFDASNFDLRLVICGDPGCSVAPTFRVLDSIGLVGWEPSLALNSGENPIVSYWDFSNTKLKLATCSDPTCNTPPILRTVNSAGQVGRYNSLALTNNDNPIIIYSNGDLNLAVCSDPTCLGVTTRILDSVGAVGDYNSLALTKGGTPVISYFDSSHADLKLYTDDVPTSPVTQFAPAGALTGVTLQPTYSWGRDATANVYTLVLYEFAGVPTLKHIEAINGFSVCNFVTNLCAYRPTAPGAILRNGVIYGWWIIPGNETGNGPWSAGKAFASFVKPANPSMITPAAGSSQGNIPSYGWNRVDGALFYTVLVLRTSDAAVMFNQSILGSICTADPCQLTQAPALNPGGYIWYVIALNSAGHSDYVGVPFGVVSAQAEIAPSFVP